MAVGTEPISVGVGAELLDDLGGEAQPVAAFVGDRDRVRPEADNDAARTTAIGPGSGSL